MVEKGQFDINGDLSYVPIGYLGAWIDYVQWNGYNLEEIRQLAVTYQNSTEPEMLYVETPIGDIGICPEFYIIKGPDGTVYVMAPSVFNKMMLTEEDLKTNLNGRASFNN